MSEYDPHDQIHWIKWFCPMTFRWKFRRYRIVDGKRVYIDE